MLSSLLIHDDAYRGTSVTIRYSDRTHQMYSSLFWCMFTLKFVLKNTEIMVKEIRLGRMIMAYIFFFINACLKYKNNGCFNDAGGASKTCIIVVVHSEMLVRAQIGRRVNFLRFYHQGGSL